MTQHLIAINLYGYAAGMETYPGFFTKKLDSSSIYVSPRGEILLYFSQLIFYVTSVCVCVFSLCVLSVYHEGGQTRDVDPMSGYCWPTDADPTIAQYWVTMSCLTPRWIRASVTDCGSTLTQLLFKALCGYYSQHEVGLTDYGWMDTSQNRRRWLNIYQTLGRCRLAVPDPQPSKHEALNQCWFYAGPASQMVGQIWASFGSTSRVFWECWQATFVFCTSPGVKVLKLLPNWLSLKTI